MLAALRGQEAEAAALIDATIKDATAGGQGTAVQYAHWANAVVMNGLGRYEEALAAAIAGAATTRRSCSSRRGRSASSIEAASRTQSTELAARALARLGERTRGSDAEWALGIEARSRALLSEGEAAELLYREAIDRLGRTRLRPELARSRLLYGEWLRRENRRVDAREQLRAAHDAFVAMGADAFAERARHELLATGEKVRRRRDDARDELTHQEQHIARLARDGLTNPEIGAQLFLSPRITHVDPVGPAITVGREHAGGDGDDLHCRPLRVDPDQIREQVGLLDQVEAHTCTVRTVAHHLAVVVASVPEKCDPPGGGPLGDELPHVLPGVVLDRDADHVGLRHPDRDPRLARGAAADR